MAVPSPPLPGSTRPPHGAPSAGAEVEPGLARRVRAGLLLAQLCFGGFHVVGKAVLTQLPPLALAAFRVGLAAPLLAWLAWRHDRLLPSRRDLPMLALLGLLGVLGNQVLFILGLQRTTAIHASILMPAMPVLTVAAAALLRVERIGARRLLGVMLSVAGALVMASPWRLLRGAALSAAAARGGAAVGAGSVARGNALILCGCACFACFLVLQRPILQRLPWRTVIAWSFVFGGLPVLLLAWPQLVAARLGAVTPLGWLGVAYVVLLATVAAYSISTWAVRRSSPAVVAAYSTLQPLVAAALAATFLGERIGWTEILGFALIAAGLWRVSASEESRGASPHRA